MSLFNLKDLYRSGDSTAQGNLRGARRHVATGIFLLVLSVYAVSSPGRIDLVDGQLRYEVAQNLLRYGRPILLDPHLWRLALPGKFQYWYTHYGIAGSLAGAPLIWFGGLFSDPEGEARRLLFSLTSGFLGAAAAALLYLFYLDLGISRKRALAWTLVSSFATLLWPASTSSFDNAQHAFFLLLAVYLGHRSATAGPARLAAWAGLAAGVLILYQDYLLILVPSLALSTLTWPKRSTEATRQDPGSETRQLGRWLRLPPEEAARELANSFRTLFAPSPEARQQRIRYLLFLVGAGVGLALELGYNQLRFGSVSTLPSGVFARQNGFPLYSDPVSGLATLLLSPGKSILLYSPPIILGLVGFRRLQRHAPSLGLTLLATSVILVLFLSNIAFVGGDWCWGPRYLVPLLPLWALAFPFVPVQSFRRSLVAAIVGAGLAVQLAALAVDHQRFFLERVLPDLFWANDSWFYFKHSALVARPREIASLRNGVPERAKYFSPGPYSGRVTYCIMGTFPRTVAPRAMPLFEVFYLPRPWPIWMAHLKPGQRPVNLEIWATAWLAMGLLGFVYMRLGFQSAEAAAQPLEVAAGTVRDGVSADCGLEAGIRSTDEERGPGHP